MNKLENTAENKARFFGNYAGQFVLKRINDLDVVFKVILKLDDFKEESKDYLLLTPLPQISDEDAIEVAKLAFGQSKFERNIKITNTTNHHFGFSFYHNSVNGDSLEYQIDFNGFYNPTLICLSRNTLPQEYIHNIQKIVDYLRAKGYALPWMGLSVDDLVDYGWIRLKKENND